MRVGGIVVAIHLIIVIGRLCLATFMIAFHRNRSKKSIWRAANDGRGSRDIVGSDVFNSSTFLSLGAHGTVGGDSLMIVDAPRGHRNRLGHRRGHGEGRSKRGDEISDQSRHNQESTVC